MFFVFFFFQFSECFFGCFFFNLVNVFWMFLFNLVNVFWMFFFNLVNVFWVFFFNLVNVFWVFFLPFCECVCFFGVFVQWSLYCSGYYLTVLSAVFLPGLFWVFDSVFLLDLSPG